MTKSLKQDKQCFYREVPKDYYENLQFRLNLREAADGNRDLQDQIIKACRHDVLFFLNFACWLYEPRVRLDEHGNEMPKTIPFITWEHQDPVIQQIFDSLGTEDVGIEKARGEGATWLCLCIFLHQWMFSKETKAFGLVSRHELAVDNPEDPDSLFSKIDWQLKQMPRWFGFHPDFTTNRNDSKYFTRNVTKHTLLNKRTGSTIVGYPATADVASGGRKAQPLDAKILTPNGWTTMGALSVGDEITAANGGVTKVVGIYPQGVKDVYRVTMTDGSSTECCDEHLWSVSEYNNRQNNKWHHDVLPLEEIRRNLVYQRPSGDKTYRYQIPIVEPVEFHQHCGLPIDPYTLGCLIGDAYMGDSGALQMASDDKEIIERIELTLPKGVRIKQDRHQVYSIVRTNKDEPNIMKNALRGLGIYGHRAWEKHVPDLYKFANVGARVELIRGLMDTDGHITKTSEKHAHCGFATVSRQLAEDIQFLVRSVGGSARMSKPKKTFFTYKGEKRQGRDSYKVTIAMPNINPFKLNRKAEQYIPRSNKVVRSIKSVELVGQKECQCIKVESDDHLYVTDDLIVTHNTAFLLDELAKFPRGADADAMSSTEPVTDCRLLVSTYYGPDGAYYDIMRQDSSMLKLHLKWEDNPTRNRGMYTVVDGKPQAIDPVNNPLPGDYLENWPELRRRLEERGYAIFDKVRSPWYDDRCLRPKMDPRAVAQEYDRDPGGSAERFYNIEVIERLQKDCRNPMLVGDLHYDAEEVEDGTCMPRFNIDPEGKFKIWIDLDVRGFPMADDFVVGCDICGGSGGDQASNSALSVVRRSTGEKVAEFASSSITPQLFAEYAIAVCYWFLDPLGNPAYLIWEVNGYGNLFTKRLLQTTFRNIYMRETLDTKTRKRSNKPGWHSNANTKVQMHGNLKHYYQLGMFSNPSREALEECKFYVHMPGGQIDHISAKSKDKSLQSTGQNHGDRVVADGLCAFILSISHKTKRDSRPENTDPKKVPFNSFLGRRNEFERLESIKNQDWW